MNRSGIAFPVIIVLAFLPVCTRAQTASVTGTVKDPTGAVVPQSRITAQNVATHAPRTAVTDESGIYRITNLAPGTYDVRIEAPGFKSVEFSRITLAVDHVQNLDATGGSTVEASVKVTGESVAPLDLNDAQIGSMVTSQQISSLALVLRDPNQLALLSPGVNQINSILAGLCPNGSGERNNNNWDTVLQKTTRITERMSVQFRPEVYNLFKRVQFNQPGNLTSDPGTFGHSTGEVTRPDGTSGARQGQFGLKFQF